MPAGHGFDRETWSQRRGAAAARKRRFGWVTGALALVALAEIQAPDAAGAADVALEQVFVGQRFVRPLQLSYVPDGSGRVAVVEQIGTIRWFQADGAGDSGTLIDLRQRISTAHNEEGLLSIAFHPGFARNGQIFVYYSAASPRRSIVARYTADPRALRVDPASELIVMEIGQPYGNHNGGQLAFGPDGFLYIGLGDGGSAGDPHGNGQNRKTLLGSILRIDVADATAAKPYGIPRDNPFVNAGDGSRPEIWAYGLRNPWRFSFDRETGMLFAGDVGQNTEEEIDRIERGGNYGWNRMEGHLCHSPPSGCDARDLELPVAVYGRGLGISVTGGFVYRGRDIPPLIGRYLFADFGTGTIWTIPSDAKPLTEPEPLLKTKLLISGFGENAAGELYVVDLRGAVYRLKAAP